MPRFSLTTVWLLLISAQLVACNLGDGANANSNGFSNANTNMNTNANGRKEQFRQTSLVQGDSYRLDCPSDKMEGSSMVEWYTGGERIHSQYDRYSVTQKGVLHIRNVQLEDSGNFTCKVVNGFGSASYTINLLVVSNRDDPRFTADPPIPQSSHPDGPAFVDTAFMRPTAVQLVSGNNVTLACKASGTPSPNITWFRNDQPLAIGRNGRSQPSARKTPRGIMLSALSVADSGRYTCRVRNLHGEIEYTYTVTVTSNGQLVPSFTNDSTSKITVSSRESLALRCATTSEASPQITWLKRRPRANLSTAADSFSPLPSLSGYSVFTELPPELAAESDKFVFLRIADDDPRFDAASNVYESVHAIERADIRDAGTYLCVAKNVHGSSTLYMHVTVAAPNGTLFTEDPTPLLPPTRPPQPSRRPDSPPSPSVARVSSQPPSPSAFPPFDSPASLEDPDQSNVMLIVYILAPLLVIIVSLVVVIYYVRARERTKRKRLRASAQAHHATAGSTKSASNSSASLSTARPPTNAGPNTLPLNQLSPLAQREYMVLPNGNAQLRLSPRSAALAPAAAHAVWPGGPQPAVHTALYADAQTMLPLLPQYAYGEPAAAPFEYYQNGAHSHSCKQTPMHQYANGSTGSAGNAACSIDYSGSLGPNGYPIYSTNVNNVPTQHSHSHSNNYNTQHAHSSTSASYTSVRVSPT